MDIKLNALMQHHPHPQHQQQHQHQHHHHHPPQHHQQQQQQDPQMNPNPTPTPAPTSTAAPAPASASSSDAPPKQVALAMDRLGQAGRLIADVRLGADRLLEALFSAAAFPNQTSKPVQLFIREDASMRQHLQDLRAIGKQLEECGVLSESLRSRSNSWGLHMPLVCPDGAVVAYAWKRQLAGQAGASAVDRTRLALKAFTDQKRRFFPHLDQPADATSSSTTEPLPKRLCVPQLHDDQLPLSQNLSDLLLLFQKQVSNVKVFTYQRLDWSKRASLLPTSANDNPFDMSKDRHAFHSLTPIRTPLQTPAPKDKVAVVELVFPSVLRAVVSLHPAGSIDPDAVAFFSPDEGGSYVHARGQSTHHVFRQITEYAGMALQHFLGIRSETALYSLLHWICTYQTIFTKVCSKCGRLLAMDRKSTLLLPPVHRPYHNYTPNKVSSDQTVTSTKDQDSDSPGPFHIGCFMQDL
ncbi:Mediator of RNA polymerase II transcription subunit 27 [Turnera subulata]|uniref:Mediator of RNA polymerase II transcription subunit 27 n=1 Tax=Turnera subulata TaxID=218843 RepID=A0A9Q0IZ75_9ROSI|nr:Mediator of RNA polymerase II transcription subunit 27 [Turnera subulata]